MQESLGSARYASPEIMSRNCYQGPEVDVWSLGVVIFAMVCGRLPFSGDGAELRRNILTANYKMPGSLSPELRELLSRIFVLDRQKRITLAEIQNSAWLRKYVPQPQPQMQLHFKPLARHSSMPDMKCWQSSKKRSHHEIEPAPSPMEITVQACC